MDHDISDTIPLRLNDREYRAMRMTAEYLVGAL